MFRDKVLRRLDRQRIVCSTLTQPITHTPRDTSSFFVFCIIAIQSAKLEQRARPNAITLKYSSVPMFTNKNLFYWLY